MTSVAAMSSILFLSPTPCAFANDPSDGHHGGFDLREAWGERFHQNHIPDPRHGHRRDLDSVRRWNQIAIDSSGYDHAHAKEQLGPCRASRALAIVHLAMFDSINAVIGQYESYTDVQAPSGPVSLEAAVSQAAHDTLAALFPSQAVSFDALLAEDLDDLRHARAKVNGIALGQRAAAAILALRANDGSAKPEPRVGTEHITSNLPEHWRQDPISLIPLALGAYWGECTPFVLQSSSQFRVPPFPSMNSPEYTIAYNEVKRLGAMAW